MLNQNSIIFFFFFSLCIKKISLFQQYCFHCLHTWTCSKLACLINRWFFRPAHCKHTHTCVLKCTLPTQGAETHLAHTQLQMWADVCIYNKYMLVWAELKCYKPKCLETVKGKKNLSPQTVMCNNTHTSEMVHNLPVTFNSMIQLFPSLTAFRISFLIVS